MLRLLDNAIKINLINRFSKDKINGERAVNYCNDNMVGGHVVFGREKLEPVEGSIKVFIVPNCRNHYRSDNGFMTEVSNKKGIALHKYLRRE